MFDDAIKSSDSSRDCLNKSNTILSNDSKKILPSEASKAFVSISSGSEDEDEIIVISETKTQKVCDHFCESKDESNSDKQKSPISNLSESNNNIADPSPVVKNESSFHCMSWIYSIF